MNIHEVGSWNDPIDQFVFATFYDLTILSKNALDRTLYIIQQLLSVQNLLLHTCWQLYERCVPPINSCYIRPIFFKGAKIEIYLKEEKTAKAETA